MHGLPFNRRQLAALQAIPALLLLAAVLAFSGASPARSGVLASRLNLQLDLSRAASAEGLRVARTRLGDVLSPAAAFDTLNRRAGGTLTVSWDVQSGLPRFLAGASRTTAIPYTPSAAERGNPMAIARGFLDENRALFRMQAVASDFGQGRMEPDAQLNYSHVRLPQMYRGIPVFGRELIVHMDPHEQIVAVNGEYAPGLNVPSQPSITKELAEQVALDDLKQSQLDAKEAARVQASVSKDKTALTVYVDPQGKATLTWSVRIITFAPMGEWTFFVNARRPAVVHAISTSESAKVRRTYTARNGTDLPGRLLLEEGERSSSDPIAQAAHDGAGKVYDYYFNTFKRDSIDGRGSPIVSSVHFGSDPQDAENAAWIGDYGQMVYGDGGQIFKPLAYGLDVIGHELTHGVIESTANLIYEGQAGALNESYADIFGAMIDRANWTVGETVVKSPPFPLSYLRSLQDPEAQNHYDPSNPLAGVGQPGSMSDYANLPLSRRADNGGVHINSGIPSHAAYFVAQALGKEKMEQIYFRALTKYLSADANFRDAGLATVQAATELYSTSEADAVRNAFRQVGIDLGGTGTTPPAPPTTTTGNEPTPGPTTQPPPENLPEGCRDAITNGGFESASGWKEVSSSNTQIIDPQLPHTGSQSAWLGGTDKESVQYIYQDISIPANATSAKLSYYRLLHEEFTGISGLFANDATFTVLLADEQGNEIQRIETLSSKQSDDAWHQAQFDLARYAGKTVRLAFSAENPRGNVSSLFVDDVTFATCTTGQPPAAPPTSSADEVYITGYVTDGNTEEGIEGAQVFILKPGISASSAAADGTVTDNEVAAEGVTDANGRYETETPIARNQTYSAIVVADGYRPILADNGIRLASDAENPTEVDATMRR